MSPGLLSPRRAAPGVVSRAISRTVPVSSCCDASQAICRTAPRDTETAPPAHPSGPTAARKDARSTSRSATRCIPSSLVADCCGCRHQGRDLCGLAPGSRLVTAAAGARLPWWSEHGGAVSEGGTGAEDGRRLVLLRHAKSDWPDVADHERPLAKRGRRDAPVVGRWLGEAGFAPDAVVCSTARRARQTWELVSTGLAEAAPGVSPVVRFEPRVYEAAVLGLLMLVREFDDAWRTAMIIGHNPGLAGLATGLASPDNP